MTTLGTGNPVAHSTGCRRWIPGKESYKVVVLNAKLVDEIDECFDEYSEEENYDNAREMLLSLICDIKLGDDRAQIYEVEDE